MPLRPRDSNLNREKSTGSISLHKFVICDGVTVVLKKIPSR